MKKFQFFLLAIAFTCSVKSQVTATHLNTFDNVNLSKILLRPDGYALAFAQGITDDCEAINVLTCSEFGDEWSVLAECDPVEWPDSYLTPTNHHFIDNDNGYVIMSQGNGGYGNPGIYKTTDGGATWEEKYGYTSDGGADGIKDFAFKDALNGIAINFIINDDETFISNFIRTTDGGESWTNETDLLFTDIELQKIIAIDGVYYVYGQDIYDWDGISWFIYKSEDGVEWTEVYSEDTPNYYSFPGAMHFLTAEIGYVVTQPDSNQYSIVKKTVDGGTSWTDITVPTDLVPEKFSFNDLYFIDENQGFIVAGNHCDDIACYRGYAILYTPDGGENWEILAKEAYAPYALYDMDFDIATGLGYVVGGDIGTEDGNIFKLSFPGAGLADQHIENLISVYPNPSNGAFSFQNITAGNNQLAIYTTDGKKVHEAIINKNDQTIHLNLAQGIYIYEVDNGTSTKNGKLIIE